LLNDKERATVHDKARLVQVVTVNVKKNSKNVVRLPNSLL